MDVPKGFDPTLILVLNLAGTFVFGLSGGLAAVRARLDLLGVVVLAAVVGLAGGVIKDLLIGTPPATFRDWRYLASAGAAGLACFFAGSALERVRRRVMVVDAFGLSLFAVTGATKALQFGLGPVQAILLGMLTGVGGGMLRDVLLKEVSTVLREGLYAVPALLGAGVLVVAQQAGSTNPSFPVLAVLACMGQRLIGLWYGVTLPTARSDKAAATCHPPWGRSVIAGDKTGCLTIEISSRVSAGSREAHDPSTCRHLVREVWRRSPVHRSARCRRLRRDLAGSGRLVLRYRE